MNSWGACCRRRNPCPRPPLPAQVRFRSPPAALASTPFQNEEVQTVTHFVPNKLFVLEAVSSTSAPYGDKFTIYFKYTLRADGPAATLHITFHIEFLPSMNRMLKPMVAKAIEGGCPRGRAARRGLEGEGSGRRKRGRGSGGRLCDLDGRGRAREQGRGAHRVWSISRGCAGGSARGWCAGTRREKACFGVRATWVGGWVGVSVWRDGVVP